MISTDDIADFLGKARSRPVSAAQVQALENPSFKRDIPDTTLKFIVPSAAGGRDFLLVSGPADPGTVFRSTEKILVVRALLSARSASAVAAPNLTGEIRGYSCASWPLFQPLEQGGQFRRLIRRWRYRDRLLEWSHALCAETLTEVSGDDDMTEAFERPLARIRSNSAFPDKMRNHAGVAIDRLRSGTWRPRHCVLHGDLWLGNILLGRDANGREQVQVIDWAGSLVRGYPMFDFARLALSLRVKPRNAAAWTNRFTTTLECAPQDLPSYGLSALGWLGGNLGHFPEHRYHAMSEKVFDFLDGLFRSSR